jgi:hypothetical protein
MRYALLRLNQKAFANHKGLVLPIALLFLGVLALLSTTAMLTTTQDIKIGRNHRASEKAFYCAQAGCEEVRARLGAKAVHPIIDNHSDQTQWKAYIGPVKEKKVKGFDANNGMHDRYDSIFGDFDFAVQIKHQHDAGDNVLYWGDSDCDGVNERNSTTGENIYVITSIGSAYGAQKKLEVEVAKIPDVGVPSALYVEARSTIQGDTSLILGNDACGTDDKPGLATYKKPGAVTLYGNPQIKGKGGGTPNVVYEDTDMDVQRLVDDLKTPSDFSYLVDSESHSATAKPGPGDGWGDPVLGATPQDPSTCSASNIVYYDTGGTFVQLADGVSGCGILLIDGDLEIHGGFSWYGPILATGSVVFTGGGDKHVTGALIIGGSAVIGRSGGSASIVYCSSAIGGHASDGPLRLLSWKEDF